MIQLTLALLFLIVAACAPENGHSPAKDSQKPREEPPSGDGPQGPSAPPSSGAIYGVWEGAGLETDASITSKLKFTFEPGRATLVKECTISESRVSGKVYVTAHSATNDEPNGSHVTLAGTLNAFSTMNGKTCSIEFPAGLEFLVREGKMIVRLFEIEKATSLKKTAALSSL